MEKTSVEKAIACTVLSKSDKHYILEQLKPSHFSPEPFVLLPPLRGELQFISVPEDVPLEKNAYLTDSNQGKWDGVCNLFSRRPYFLCCVRLSPEKEPSK